MKIVLKNKHFKGYLLENGDITYIDFNNKNFALEESKFNRLYPEYKKRKKRNIKVIREIKKR